MTTPRQLTPEEVDNFENRPIDFYVETDLLPLIFTLRQSQRKAEALDKLQWLANRHNWATVFTTTLETRLYLEDGTGKLSYVAPDLLTAIEKAQAMKVK